MDKTRAFLSKYSTAITLTLITLFSLIFIIYPVIRYNPGINRDLAGHVFAIEFTKNFLLPDFQGWNPFHNLGYPQGTFYPAFFHYIIALGSSVIGTPQEWIKVLFSIALLAMPFAIYYFVKQLQKQLGKDNSVILNVTVLIMMGFMYFFPQTLSGSVRATLGFGLITNFLTQPLLFLFLGRLLKLEYGAKINKKHIVILAFLLATIMLAHQVLGLFAVILSVGLMVCNAFTIKENKIKTLLTSSHFIFLTVTFFAVCFFYISYILNSRYLTASVPLISPIEYSLLIFFLLGVVVLFFSFKKLRQKLPVSFEKNNFYYFSFIIFIISCIPAIDSIADLLGDSINFQLVHAYRILPYIFFLGLPAVILFSYHTLSATQSFKVLQKVTTSSVASISVMVLIFVSYAGLFYKVDLGQRGYGDLDVSDVFTQYQGGNFINIYSINVIYDLHKEGYYDTIYGKWNNFSLVGQFEESSYINHFAYSIQLGMDTDLYHRRIFSKNGEYIEELLPPKVRVEEMVDLFNINTVMATNRNNINYACRNSPQTELIKFKGRGVVKENEVVSLKYEDKSLFTCQLNPSAPSQDYEIIDTYNPRTLRVVDKKAWDSEVIKWWSSEERAVLVEKNSTIEGILKNYSYDSSEQYKIFNATSNHFKWDSNFQGFSMSLPKEEDKLAIVKTQYNPRWKAYEVVDGKETGKILDTFRLSPSLMAVYGKGDIHFKYEFAPWEKVLKNFSLTVYVTLAVSTLIIGILSVRKSKTK